MSQMPVFSYKQYLDDMIRLKDHGHVSADTQIERPNSAGSRGLRKIKNFIDDPVHLMGEEAPRPSPIDPNPKTESNCKKITKNEAIKAVLEGISYSKSSGELILPEAIQGNFRTWFESSWTKVKNKK
jgi:hypothetical protein